MATVTVTGAAVGAVMAAGQVPIVTEPPDLARMDASQARTSVSRMERSQMRVSSRFSVSRFVSRASAGGMRPRS